MYSVSQTYCYSNFGIYAVRYYIPGHLVPGSGRPPFIKGVLYISYATFNNPHYSSKIQQILVRGTYAVKK